jgi:hypothetical protein
MFNSKVGAHVLPPTSGQKSLLQPDDRTSTFLQKLESILTGLPYYKVPQSRDCNFQCDMYIRGLSKRNPTFLLKLLLISLQLNKTCLLQSTPLHCLYTASNDFSSSGTRPGTRFAG